MEFSKVEKLLEKYFEGATSIAEEKELRSYFSTQNVAPHLEQYKVMFGFFAQAKQQEFTKKIPLQTKKSKIVWLSIAATIVVVFGLSTMYILNNPASINKKQLGSYDSPEVAFIETQKALALLSSNVNIGMKSVMYVHEYETAKNRVFKK